MRLSVKTLLDGWIFSPIFIQRFENEVSIGISFFRWIVTIKF